MNRGFINLTIFLLVFLYSCTSKTVDKDAQAKNDSIKKYLDLAGNDTIDSKLKNKYNDKAFSLVDLSKNDTLTRFYLSSISFNYMKTKEWIAFNKNQRLLFDKSIVEHDTLNLARYYRYKAAYFNRNKVYDSSFYFITKAEKFYKKTNDLDGLAKNYLNKCQIQFCLDDYLGAELSAKKAYLYYKHTQNYKKISYCIINLGNIYHNLKDYDKAILYHEKALNIIIEKKIPSPQNLSLQGSCLNNIGNAYREQFFFNRAIYYFKKALEEKKLLLKDPELYGLLLNNLGYCEMQLNDYSKLPFLFEKSAKIFDSLNVKNECAISYIYLSDFHYKNKDTLKANFFAEKALRIAKQSKAPYYYLTALSNAGIVNSKKASKYIKEYHKKSDSLLFIERNARNQYYKIQLETEEITQEKETAIKQKWIIGGLASFVILIIALLLIITKQRSKQKELQFQQSQQKANEEIYDLMLTQKNKEELARQSEKKRIAQELHDGVMNKLASTRLNLNILSNQKDEETVNKCLTHIEGIYKIEQEIRNIAHNLNLEIFNETNSFVTMLNEFVATQNATTNSIYKIETDTTIDWSHISSGIKMNLYRIIQEASNNVNKFAQATNVMISLILDEKNICLSVTDNGKGFDTDANAEGIGLKNIKQRVESLNGKYVIQSKNKSTSINIAIPIEEV